MPNNRANWVPLAEGVSDKGASKVVTPIAYTVTSTDNFVICGEDSTVITLDSDSNSPVYISTIEDVTAHTGCTVADGTKTWVLADSGCAAEAVRFAGTDEWILVGAKTAS